MSVEAPAEVLELLAGLDGSLMASLMLLTGFSRPEIEDLGGLGTS